jgi:hypothetical protein
MRIIIFLSVIASLVGSNRGSLLRGVTMEQGIELGAGKMVGERQDVTDVERRKVLIGLSFNKLSF